MKITYVILNYMAFKDTIECIESIFDKYSNSNKNIAEIVVVDNGSPNNSYEKLKELYEDMDAVYLLHSEQNLGFAKGNNIGFKFAKESLKTDFIVMLNSDTIIIQEKFNDLLIEKYNKYSYSVLGPDILTCDNYHQNPYRLSERTNTEVLSYLLKHVIFLFSTYIGLHSLKVNRDKKVRMELCNNKVEGDILDIVLHGSCMIFSPLYIKQFDGIYDGTFLYMEEDILKLYAENYGFLMLYSSDLVIYHKEKASTNMVSDSSLQKNRKRYKYCIHSALEYIKVKYKFRIQRI